MSWSFYRETPREVNFLREGRTALCHVSGNVRLPDQLFGKTISQNPLKKRFI
jgi:hypothetical protein